MILCCAVNIEFKIDNDHESMFNLREKLGLLNAGHKKLKMDGSFYINLLVNSGEDMRSLFI